MVNATEKVAVTIRDVESVEDIKAIEDLQIEAWGDAERDIVPLNQLVAARHVGGSLIGAFDGAKLAGFVYGFYGHIAGGIVHHSHMLAVRPGYRSHNLGFRLKAAQRERVLADGITDRMTWTFDPLQSLNAHLNFAKLGVLSDTYKTNVYGEQGGSFLHRNGTDRLFVTWLLESERVRRAVARPQAQATDRTARLSDVPRLLYLSRSGHPQRGEDIADASSSAMLAIEIPADIISIERSDFDMARKWREETRHVFTEALAAGYVATDYVLDSERSGFYILRKGPLDRLGE